MILPYLFVLGQLNELAMSEFILDTRGCPTGFFPCDSPSVCIPQSLYCNDIKDCENGADEADCDDYTGLSDIFEKVFPAIQNENISKECFLKEYPQKCDCRETELECVDVNLRYVPQVSLNVTLLSLKHDKIKNLPADVFIKYTDLDQLFLHDNQIRSIAKTAFAGLYKLRRLYISQNRITALKPRVFQDLHRLHFLSLDDNLISKISPRLFIGLKSLLVLSMVNNLLEKLPKRTICAEIPNVRWLDFDNNRIKSLDYSTFLNCEKLLGLTVGFDGNLSETLDYPKRVQAVSSMTVWHSFSVMLSARKKYLHHNEITTISEKAFAPLYRLIELEIASNKIQELPKYSFKNVKLLRRLNISNNPLKLIHLEQFDTLNQLQSLSLEGIEITNIESRMFKSMTSLEHIYFNKFQYCAYSTRVRSCQPNTDGISSFEDLLANIILRVFVWVIACLTCFGNLFVIFMRSLIRAENKLHAMSIKILCCADCLMGVYLFFVGIFDVKYRGEYNRHAQLWMNSIQCRMIGFLAMLSTEVSVLLLTYLSLEKYIVIVFPFSNVKPGKYQTLITHITIWFIGFTIAIIPLWNEDIFGNYYGRNGVCFPLHADQVEKDAAKGYSIGIFLGLNLIAFIIIVFSYSSMFYSMHKTGIQTPEMKRHIRSEVAVAYRFFFIVLSDALCWIPIFLLKVLSLIQVEIPGTITSWVVIFILPINSALNPILYTLTTSFFREKMKQFLCKHQKINGKNMWTESSSRQSISSVKLGFLKRASAAEDVMNSRHH